MNNSRRTLTTVKNFFYFFTFPSLYYLRVEAVSQVVLSSIDELSEFRLIGIHMQRLKDLIKENRIIGSILLAISITSATYLRFDFYAHVS